MKKEDGWACPRVCESVNQGPGSVGLRPRDLGHWVWDPGRPGSVGLRLRDPGRWVWDPGRPGSVGLRPRDPEIRVSGSETQGPTGQQVTKTGHQVTTTATKWLPLTTKWLPPTTKWLPPTTKWLPPTNKSQPPIGPTLLVQTLDQHYWFNNWTNFIGSIIGPIMLVQ